MAEGDVTTSTGKEGVETQHLDLGAIGDWKFTRTEQMVHNIIGMDGQHKPNPVRYMATRRRLLNPETIEQQKGAPEFWQTVVILDTQTDTLAIYGVKVVMGEEVAGHGKPDPVPVDLIASLEGLRCAWKEE